MADVTNEVWRHSYVVDPQSQVRWPGILRVDRPEDIPMVLFHGWGGGETDGEEGLARARLAAMAPTFFRMLERVLASGTISPELEWGIRANLHRASPDTHAMPVDSKDLPRRSSWERLRDDD